MKNPSLKQEKSIKKDVLNFLLVHSYFEIFKSSKEVKKEILNYLFFN